ncbi:MAG: GNAT family N-acetyltransferase [Ilumatobacter sp.]|nr:GNAT family N-acetyltransferase [Ilumatobacter sp.]
MGSLAVGTLTGTHVELEPLRVEHIDAIAVAGSGDRSTFTWTAVPADRGEAERYVRGLLDDAAHHRVAPFVQRRRTDGTIVGCTRFMDPHWPLGRDDPDEVEVGGTWLNAEAQRTALNSDAKLLLLSHAFDVWGVQRVAVCTDERNAQSRRAIERLGARLDGVLPKHRRTHQVGVPPHLRNTAVYSIVDDDWPAVRDTLRRALSGR